MSPRATAAIDNRSVAIYKWCLDRSSNHPTNHHKHVRFSRLSCSIACGCSLRLPIFYHLSFMIIILILLWCLVRHWNLVLHFSYWIITYIVHCSLFQLYKIWGTQLTLQITFERLDFL
jgi:hypothetical protein